MTEHENCLGVVSREDSMTQSKSIYAVQSTVDWITNEDSEGYEIYRDCLREGLQREMQLGLA